MNVNCIFIIEWSDMRRVLRFRNRFYHLNLSTEENRRIIVAIKSKMRFTNRFYADYIMNQFYKFKKKSMRPHSSDAMYADAVLTECFGLIHSLASSGSHFLT